MRAFILRRLLHVVPVLLGVSFLSFFIIHLTPGDFLTTMSLNPEISAERIQKLRDDFGLDKPWFVQYGLWLYRLSPVAFPAGVKWPDLGYSFANKTPVTILMKDRFFNTMLLAFASTLLVWFVAVPLGIFAALHKQTWVDKLSSFVAFAGISVPEVLLALLALLFAAETGWFPIGGMRSLDHEELPLFRRLLDLLHHLVLPTLVLGITGIAGLMRYMRGSLLDTLYSDYVRTARAKGLPERAVILKHALRNAVNPLITIFGLSFGTLISHTFLIEVIMGWPGLGSLTYNAVLSKDLYVIMAGLIFSTVLLIIGNLLADALLAFSDPRIRYGAQ